MATRTRATVVAVFRNTSDAQAAAQELEANGFNEEDIYISSADYTGSSTEQPVRHEGGIAGWFKRVFGGDDEGERRYYEQAVSSGNVLLSVDTDEDNVERVGDILDRYSPLDMHRGDEGSSTAASSTAGAATGGASATAGRTSGAQKTNAADQSRAIPVVEEELKVGKRAILKGGVRVYSRVVEQPVEETVNLRDERVRVDRQKVNRPVTDADLRSGRDEVIEVEEFSEEPVVSKEARVVEEVRINKESNQRTEKVKDTVRRTEVNVEKLDQQDTKGTSGTRDIDEDFRRDFTSRYGTSGVNYDTYAPAYRYGYDMASDPRYQGRDFSQVEDDLRSDYGRRYPNSTWDKMKDSIRYGWNKVTGKSSSATTSR